MGALDDISGAAKAVLKVGVTDDTAVHQLNRLYVVVYLVILAMLVSARQYVGAPIFCYCPAEFKKSQLEYVHSLCWVKNTYAVPFEEGLPRDDEKRLHVLYYQWVPLIFVFQAFLFYLPRMFWKHMSSFSGLNLKRVLCLADSATYLPPAKRSESLDNIVNFLDKWIEIRDNISSRNRKVVKFKKRAAKCGIHFGNFICFTFVVTGILYLLNSILQIIFLDAILGNDFANLGPDFINGLVKNKKWEDLHRFPRVTYCDFIIRQLTNAQTWTVQCSLPINLFNEKMFTTLWFVLIGMAVINSCSVLWNTFIFFWPSRKHSYIQKYYTKYEFPEDVRRSHKLPEVEKEFVNNYLKQDGVFLIWMVCHTASPVVADELVSKLIKLYIEKPLIRDYLFPSNGDLII